MTMLTDHLDPAIRTWLARAEELLASVPGATTADLAARRAAARTLSDALAEEFTAPAPPNVVIEEIELAGLRAKRFLPPVIAAPAPTQLFLHGGGFFAGTIDETLNDRLCAARALAAGIQIVSLEYRLAPEHRYPAPVEDAIAALEELRETPGVDAARLGIGGNSAGAAIAASTAVLLRDRGDLPLIHQGLEVLPGALRPVGASALDFARGVGLDDAGELAELYVGNGTMPYAASPLDVRDLEGLPPALIMVAEYDPLRDSGIAFAARLTRAGVPVQLVIGAGHVHGSPGLTAAFPRAKVWQHRHAAELARAYRTR